MTDRPAVSVIVPTYNRVGMLVDCLDSLEAQDPPPGGFEIIVADDASTDGTAGVLDARSSDLIRVVRLERNGGPGVARNRAISTARAPILAFIDDDKIAPPGWLRRGWQSIRQAPSEVLALGGPYQLLRPLPHHCPRCRLPVAGAEHAGKREVSWLLGGNAFVLREAFERYGPFRPLRQGEDDEFFRRLPKGAKWWDDQLVVYHRVAELSPIELLRKTWNSGRWDGILRHSQGRGAEGSPRRAARYLAHAVRHRCAGGWLLAAREAGRLSVLIPIGTRP